MDNSKDIGFTFDPKPFENGIKKASDSTSGLEKAMKKSSENMSKSMTWAMAKGMMLANGIMAIGKSIAKGINEQIPEIGQAFGIAKEIIFKNLFWPLRQQLVPMLQSMLNWVRDNRGMFLKWGQVLANVFNVVVQVAKVLWNSLKGIGEALAPILGAANGGLGDAINLIVAKIAVVAAYISRALEPVIGGLKDFIKVIADSGIIGKLVDFAIAIGKVVWNSISSFFEGLSKWIAPAVKALTGIVGSLGDMWDLIFGKNGDGLNGFFQLLAGAQGWVDTTVLDAINIAVRLLVTAIVWLKEGIRSVQSLVSKIPGMGGAAPKLSVADAMNEVLIKARGMSDMTAINSEFGKGGFSNQSEFIEGGQEAFARAFWSPEFQKKLAEQISPADKHATGTPFVSHDGPAFLHQGERVVTKSENKNYSNGSVTINLNVTEGGARQAGVNFADGLQYQLRSQLAHEAMTGGR